ncbi:hypothetical protein MUN77_02645 [Leucobacter allii]|uniref:hypothetical protein n=1 Tax=Leucobacter allii TaxID=2932247 RepID=UPI001FD2196A|nr:hypothetical protein [Leucobacter allii]UOR02250.1 hypothetical protein MUN77_02645 [Leucobacter allii]
MFGLPKLRNDYPAWLNSLIDAVADRPMSLIGRLAALRLGIPRRRDDPGVSEAGTAPRRLLIAPVNYSDQSTQWARALREALPGTSTATMAIDVPGGFAFPSDLVVPVPVYHNSRHWQRRQRHAVRGFTHVLVEAEEPLFGRLMRRDPGLELAWMRAAGIDVAFMAHGTDIRVPSAHAARSRWSPYHDREMYTQRLERVARRNIALLRGSGRPIFVSTPDLLLDLPEALWCPVVVDPDRWAAAADAADRREPGTPLRVTHAPSVSLIKGTQLIEPVLERLDAEGVISYRAVRGVASADMPAAYAATDVVLDQFRLGSYGVAACEAMAAGKVVIGHVAEQVRARVRADAGSELPILEATPDTLEAELRRLADDHADPAGAEIERARRSGQAFVQRWHSGAVSARILIDHWLEPASRGAASDPAERGA